MNWMRPNEPPSTCASVLTVSVFARPGHAFEQDVAARQQRDEQPLEHRVLADDHALDLVQRVLKRLAGRRRGRGWRVVHVCSLTSDEAPEPAQGQCRAREDERECCGGEHRADLARLVLAAELGAQALVDLGQALASAAWKACPPDAEAI